MQWLLWYYAINKHTFSQAPQGTDPIPFAATVDADMFAIVIIAIILGLVCYIYSRLVSKPPKK